MPEANDQFNRAPQTTQKHGAPQPLQGKTAVVTGSSSGIGRAIALRLAEAGAAVHVHCKSRREEAEQVAAAIQAYGTDATVGVADLSDSEARNAFSNLAWQWQQGVDIWVNNAGADVLTGDMATASYEEKLARLWEVDVLATVHLSRQVGAWMQQRSTPTARPSLINIGWDQADVGMAGESGEMFAAIKGAVMAFSKSLAKSLAPEVRVNCVAPGWIKTSWGETASDYWQQRACQEALLGRWGTPQDVAEAVYFLASSKADFITGHVLPVNGGFRGSWDAPDQS